MKQMSMMNVKTGSVGYEDSMDIERLVEPRTDKQLKGCCLQKEQAIKLEKQS